MLVCADLLSRGFEVFRAISPSATCDLILAHPGGAETVRVEVRCAHFRGPRVDGQIFWSVVSRKGAYDLFVIVMPDGTIHYDPPLGTAPTIEWVGQAAFRLLPLETS